MRDINIFAHYEVVGAKKRIPVIIGIFFLMSMILLGVYLTISKCMQIRTLKAYHDDNVKILQSKESQKTLKDIRETEEQLHYLQLYKGDLNCINREILDKDIIKDKIINDIFDIVPKEVSVNSLSLSMSELVLECNANRIEAVGHLLYNLKNMGIFTEVYSPGVNEDEEGKYIFSVTATMKEVNTHE